MSFDCLFLINGLGLGNSTRCYAIIRQLLEKGVRVHVLTSHNGHFFFSDKPGLASLHTMENFFYSGSHGKVSAWKTMAALPKLHRIALKKQRRIAAVLDEVKPRLVVTDSEYTLSPVRRRRIPIVAVNNSDVVVSEYLAGTGLPLSIAGQFWVVEFMDYLFHKRYCDLVISPALADVKPRHGRIRRVGPIVRHELAAAVAAAGPRGFPEPARMKNVVFMMSGSIFATEVDVAACRFPFHIDVVGRKGVDTAGVTFHGKLANNIEYLLRADALVVNGGFSAVSEAAVLRKPTLVLPVPGHAEQYMNALALAQCGLGYNETAATVVGRLEQVMAANAWAGLDAVRTMLPCDGAAQAADLIVNRAEGRA